ncbi:SpaA isopeptide-forming pilin-related protein [Streptomyces sp. NBC_01244]|uniref:SpaA isopeptide-forming pilin-related protein n=1 Tax=Streptomyces sp. NBC_01244 TaxID=2903797 RepID=UPI002E146E85|nr:SpaA isopeptide-forming pilin-related protein [Streptomyces sp. NBC_01244]
MSSRSARRKAPTAAIAVAAAATGALTWAPSASAEAPEPTPSTSAPAPRSMPEPEPGGVEIHKKDPAGATLEGAQFSLLDTVNGTKALQGKTGADGILRFEKVTPGVYRLKETDSGSAIHDLAEDRDIIVTPGQVTPVTVVDPFKPAELTVKKTDKTTGKPLAGAVINIRPSGTGGEAVTLTTGKDGTAKAQLTVTARSGSAYTATETKAPSGYQLDSSPVQVTAKPAAGTTAEFTNTPTATTPPTQQPSKPPTTKPKPTPDTSAPATPTPDNTSSTPAPSDTPTSTPTPPAGSDGQLARTGAGSTSWLAAAGGLLISAGGGAIWAVRRRRANQPDDAS